MPTHLAFLVLFVGASCTPRHAAPEVVPALSPVASAGLGEGSECWKGVECESGICEGMGCDNPGQCMPRIRSCYHDVKSYCTCDGVNYGASGNCPGIRYAYRGVCKFPSTD